MIRIFSPKEKECGNPGVPEQAYVLGEVINSPEKSYSYQDAVVYACEKGYKMVESNPIRVCNESGMWSGVPVKCESIQILG